LFLYFFFSDTILHTFAAKSIKSIGGESIPQGYFQSRDAGKGCSLSIRFALLFFCFYHRSNSASPPNPHFTVFIFFLSSCHCSQQRDLDEEPTIGNRFDSSICRLEYSEYITIFYETCGSIFSLETHHHRIP
jgi:hypothetical protein